MIRVPDLKCYVTFTTSPSYIGILAILLMYYTTFLNLNVCNVCVLAFALLLCPTFVHHQFQPSTSAYFPAVVTSFADFN